MSLNNKNKEKKEIENSSNKEKEIKTKTKIKKETKSNINEKKDTSKKRVYFSFNMRFFLALILFIVCAIVSFLLIMMSFSIINEKTIDYQEKSNIDYRVYLKENEFYEEEYLGKDMVYVSSLIKNIETDFKYNFNITENSNINFDYNVVGKLLITDANGSKTFFEKDYTLLENKNKIIDSDKKMSINETININYIYYNDLANRYRQQYGVNSQSYFIVTLNVNKVSLDDNLKLNDNNGVMSIRIPLAQNEVNIRIDSNELNNNSNIISESMLQINNVVNILIGVLVAIVSIILFFKILKYMFVLIPKSSEYDKILGKILKEYDRLIVETSTPPDEEHLKVVRVYKFVELLDVRDNLSQPIKYFNITKHQKCVFYINYGDEIYIYTLKAVDIDKN